MDVTIVCPVTGRDVRTGIDMDEKSFKNARMQDNVVRCSECGNSHTWGMGDASLQGGDRG